MRPFRENFASLTVAACIATRCDKSTTALRAEMRAKGGFMPRGSKSKYTSKQKRKAEHIEEGYEKRGTSKKEAERRAWATVNKSDRGGKKSGSGRGKKSSKASSRKGGRKGGGKKKR
jgi:plasmid stabilization system protein ParE